MATDKVVNIVIAGLGGQGVLKASDILADTAFRSGADVKKAEVHGMSQRGGSVTSDVRFGGQVLSPMVPPGAADYLVVLEETQVEPAQGCLRDGGTMLVCTTLADVALPSPRTLNVAMLGLLSPHLSFDRELWRSAIHAAFPVKLHEMNDAAFDLGRGAATPEDPQND